MRLVARRRWRSAPLYIGLLSALLLCGCGSPSLIPLRGVQVKDLSQSSIGVVVLMPEKKIGFCEHQYRALWNETLENYYSFEGIWDPAPIVQRACIHALEGRFRQKALPLWGALEPAAYGKLVSVSEAAYNSARIRTGPDAIHGVASYSIEFSHRPPLKYLDAPPVADMLELRRLGPEYVLEVSIHAFQYSRHGPYTVPVVLAYARLIRLADGVVVWADNGIGGVKKLLRGLDSFADLEADNLALIKKHFEDAVGSLFGQEGHVPVRCIFDRLPTG